MLILYPAYVAGLFGVICGLESDQYSQRWLIRVDPENIMVSLPQKDFQVVSQDKD